MNMDNLGTQSAVELEAFRFPLAIAVASKLAVFKFAPMDEGDLRAAIALKDSKTLQLMDEYFALFLECGKSWTIVVPRIQTRQ